MARECVAEDLRRKISGVQQRKMSRGANMTDNGALRATHEGLGEHADDFGVVWYTGTPSICCSVSDPKLRERTGRVGAPRFPNAQNSTSLLVRGG